MPVEASVKASISEDTSRRFDGRPRTISARYVGKSSARAIIGTQIADLELRASGDLSNTRSAFPLLTQVFAQSDPSESVLKLGKATAANVDTPRGPAQLDWSAQCGEGECVLPISMSLSFVPSLASGETRPPDSMVSVDWWVEARVELFSDTGELRSGTLTLTPK